MPTARLLSAALLLALATPAAAQLANRAIAVETGISTSLSGDAGTEPVVALLASTWLEGPVEAIARLELASAPRTAGRPQAARLAGTVGLRISLLPDPVRPQLGLELGWARTERSGVAEHDLAIAVGAGVEWFPERNLSVALRAGLRRAGAPMGAEVLVGAAAYF